MEDYNQFIHTKLKSFIKEIRVNHDISVSYTYPDMAVDAVYVDLDGDAQYLTHDSWEYFKRGIDIYFQGITPAEIDKYQKEWERKEQERLERGPLACPDTTPIPFLPITKNGNVYILKAGPYYKIGRTNNVDRRMGEICPKLPFEAEIVHVIEAHNMYEIEAELHRLFNEKRANGEWFELSQEDVEWLKTL